MIITSLPAKQSGRRRLSFPIADWPGFTADRRFVWRHGLASSTPTRKRSPQCPTGMDDWIVDDKEVYENTKRVAFLEFAELPRLTKQPLELALFLRTAKDAEERRDLEKRGWHVRPSR